ncbi:MAG TPA: hypothetical protein VHW90_11680 [Stellaceae bacterium]|jgi:hypothetical protein|nr:hypothetical protein [Stellaceae bacterium]
MQATRFLALELLLVISYTAPPAAAADPAIMVVGPSGKTISLTLAAIAQLPTTQLNVSYETEHGARKASFEGPLLWNALAQLSLVDPAKERDALHEALLITGTDGYSALLALGEIAPAFEGKQVIIAEKMDGKPYPADQVRVVVPGDKRGGRYVRGLARIEFVTPQPGH